MRLSVYEAVIEVETEADSVRLFEAVLEDDADEEEETVLERVLLSVDDADFVSDTVSECVADRLPEGLSNKVTLLVPLTDKESDALLLVDTLRLGVALSVRQLRPP